nr:sulfatase-like hydrolase/transferase [Campylobacter concisus]
MIVGETQRSKNYSLNGYAKNNTNKFTKQNDVVSFTNFYSCGTATETSVPCLFSDLKREDFSNREAKARENLVDIINKLGIKTYFFGNNSGGCKGVCDNLDQNHTSDHRAESFDEVIFNEAKKVIPPPLSCYIFKARMALSTTKVTQANLKNLPQLAILPS